MGAQVEQQRELVAQLYDDFYDDDIPKFHYGSHYSTMGFVLYYLLRVEPFTAYHKGLQSGRFDHADRLFHSFKNTYHSCTHSSSDVKELVPEMFYLPDALLNHNELPLGTRQDGQQVGDVVLPPWATNAVDFIAKHRAALESEYVSAHLHEWVDLIFGCKQRGPSAVSALNVFFHLTYEENVNLSRLTDLAELRSLKAQINNFGQTPPQLLVTPHPQRRPRGPPAWPLAPPGSMPVAPVGSLRVESVPIAMLHVDEQTLVLDASRRLVVYKSGAWIGRSPATPVAVGEAGRLPAFAPRVTLSRAVALFTSDGRGREAWLASGGHWDNSLLVSAAHGSGSVRHRLCCHSEFITCVVVSSCGRWVLTGSDDATAILWSVPSGKMGTERPQPTHVLRGHSAPLLCVALSSVMRLAASGARDGTAALYTLRGGTRVALIQEPSGSAVEQVLLADSGYVILVSTAGSQLHLFSLNGLLVWSNSLPAGISALSLTPCHSVLVCGFDDGSLRAWSVHDHVELTRYVPCPAPVVCLSVGDGFLLVGTSRTDVLRYPMPPVDSVLLPGIVVQ
uniref:BEACH domain-containing protein n=1 Tax=Coccolithus braarudii TaxID=221442 RepID=A0A7S0L8V8_9EUKA